MKKPLSNTSHLSFTQLLYVKHSDDTPAPSNGYKVYLIISKQLLHKALNDDLVWGFPVWFGSF